MEMLASMQNLTAAVATSNYGKKIMQTMGWSEQVVFVFVSLCSGQGLGREGTGIKESIIVKKKSNEEGVVVVEIAEIKVGFNEERENRWNHCWWFNAYDSAVKKIGSNSTESDSESDSVSSVPKVYTGNDSVEV